MSHKKIFTQQRRLITQTDPFCDLKGRIPSSFFHVILPTPGFFITIVFVLFELSVGQVGILGTFLDLNKTRSASEDGECEVVLCFVRIGHDPTFQEHEYHTSVKSSYGALGVIM